MIHYFNPGHESAVLNASKFYMPPKAAQEMRRDFSYLPAWYAAPSDFILTERELPNDFRNFINENIGKMATAVTKKDLPRLNGQNIDLWGISPQVIYFFEKSGFVMPAWNNAYRQLGSRFAAAKCLKYLIERLPEIEPATLPRFFSNLNEIETFVKNASEKILIKSPFSSSGRGLVWLPPAEEIARSERQILAGMLRKQSAVSLEKALDKVLDFSLHFENAQFIGYSVFYTSAKGAYEKSLLASQSFLEKHILKYIDISLLHNVKKYLTHFLRNNYMPVYKGVVGIDMLAYKSNGKYFLQPCIEINMRKSMGYLAIQLHKNYIDSEAIGYFYCSKKTSAHKIQTPVFKYKRLVSGCLDLCPVSDESVYCAYVEI